MSKKKNKKSEIVAIVSDIHFDLHDVPTWKAFRYWHKDVRPDKTVILGDFLDLGMVSRYTIGKEQPLYAIDQVKCFVEEANSLEKECNELIVVSGNHDERWDKYVHGNLPFVLKDSLGLTIKDQCYAQGLSKKVSWVQEDLTVKGVKCGPYMLRHGHNQQKGRFGGGKHLAANRVAKTLGQSEIFGHFHRAQMFCQTASGKTAVAISNPCMTGNHEYDFDPDWQRGFTVLELYGPNKKYATPYVILIDNGCFSYGGKIYDGNK